MNRVVCLLLVPAVLLTQRAVLGHGHGRAQPAGHDLRPHFHTSLTSPYHAPDGHHGHHHHGPGGHHHHDGDDGPGPNAPPAPQPEPLSDHDADAVLVTGVDAVVERSQGGEAAAGAAPWFLVESGMAPGSREAHSARPARRGHPPPHSFAPERPLFLRHLALLI